MAYRIFYRLLTPSEPLTGKPASWLEVKGRQVHIPGLEAWRFFAVTRGQWTEIFEVTSGAKAGRGIGLKAAKVAVQRRVFEHFRGREAGLAYLADAVALSVAKNGVAPQAEEAQGEG